MEDGKEDPNAFSVAVADRAREAALAVLQPAAARAQLGSPRRPEDFLSLLANFSKGECPTGAGMLHNKRVEPAVAPQGRPVEDAFKSDLQVLQEQFAKAPAPVSTPQPLRDHHATCDTYHNFHSWSGRGHRR